MSSESTSKVVIHTRPWCIWCIRAKRLLRSRGARFVEVDASDPAARAALEAKTGRKTVPQVFIGDEHVGGYDDLAALHANGELDRRLGTEARPGQGWFGARSRGAGVQA